MATPALRPLSLGEVLDVSFGLYRSMFAPLITVAAVCQAIPMLLAVYLGTSGTMLEHLGLSLLYFALSVILSALGVAASTFLVSDAYLGQATPAMVALSRATALIGKLIAVSLLSWFLIGLGFILLFFPGLILLPGLVLSTVVTVLEAPPGATAAMARSWELTRGFRNKILLAMGVTFLLLVVPGIAIGGAAAMFGDAAGTSVGVLVLESLLQILIYPYVYVVMTVLYYDLRVRKEGFDLELLASTLSPA